MIPNAGERPLDARGYFTKPWLAYLRELGVSGSDAQINAELADLRGRIAAIEARGEGQITGPASVRVAGTLKDGVVQLTLQGDAPNPGATYYYGTDAAGLKGFFPIPSVGNLDGGHADTNYGGTTAIDGGGA